MLIRMDDLCLQQYLDILEGKVQVNAETLSNIIECGRKKIASARGYYKGKLLRVSKIAKFAEQNQQS